MPTLVTGGLTAAIVGAVLLIGNPTAGSDRSVAASEPATATPSPAPPATVEEFCSSFAALSEAHEAALQGVSTATVTRLKEAAQSTRATADRTGALSSDARQGIAFVLDLFSSLPEDATYAQLASSDHVPTFAEEAQADAFIAFLDESCPRPAR